MSRLLLVFALAGGGALSGILLPPSVPAAAELGPSGGAPPLGVLHMVRMQGNRFMPAHLVIASGDVVEFRNGSGGPHNVAFWADSIPAESAERLRAAMPDTIGPLIGPLVFGGNERYVISFTGAPAGEYRYYCLPHVSGGMVGVIEVSDR